MTDKVNYDEELVVFCKRCYSLSIIHEEAIGEDCCKDCGCSDIATTTIEEWEKLYKNRYGHSFINDKGNIRNSPIFKAPINKLKNIVCNTLRWREICKTLYPKFPGGLSKADSIVLLFAKLQEDNRIDELKMYLIEQNKNKQL